MRKLVLTLAAVAVLSTLSLAAPKSQTFTGEIMDSQCSAMGSHAEMLKKEGMAGKDPNDPMAKKSCTQGCVKMGGKYVLFDAASKTVYQLDDQTKPEAFAGAQVKVKGTLDKDTNTIHVASIRAGS
jgi:hypothetical protein